MKHYFKPLLLLIIAVGSLGMTGCAAPPLGPTVQVMPAPGKPLDMYQREYLDCKKMAFDAIGGQAAVDQVNNQAITNALVGVGTGVLAGALVGQAAGDQGGGAQVGAAAGLLAGTGAGAAGTAQGNMTMQQMYDNFFSQCMYAKGNQVPGMAQATPEPAFNEIDTHHSSHERRPDQKLMKAQQALAEAGYDPGSADGFNGRKTKEALRLFQKDHSLKVTGRLDGETLSMLSNGAKTTKSTKVAERIDTNKQETNDAQPPVENTPSPTAPSEKAW